MDNTEFYYWLSFFCSVLIIVYLLFMLVRFFLPAWYWKYEEFWPRAQDMLARLGRSPTSGEIRRMIPAEAAMRRLWNGSLPLDEVPMRREFIRMGLIFAACFIFSTLVNFDFIQGEGLPAVGVALTFTSFGMFSGTIAKYRMYLAVKEFEEQIREREERENEAGEEEAGSPAAPRKKRRK